MLGAVDVGAVEVLAVNNFGDTRSGGLAGPMGLFIIVILGIGTVLLIRNMNARLRRLPESFPDPEADRREAEAARRAAEIARLDADLTLPDAETNRAAPDPSAAPGQRAPTARPDATGPQGPAGESTDRP